MLENSRKSCSCLNSKCVRHGDCKECIKHHSGGSKLPFCKRPENIELAKKDNSFKLIIC